MLQVDLLHHSTLGRRARVQSDDHHAQANLPAAKTTIHTMRNRNIETAKLACFLNFLRPSLIRVVRRKNIERTKRKIGIAAAMKAMILKIIVHSQCRVTRSFDHLVGACGEAGRHFEPEYFGTLEVDNKLELGGLIDRQIGGLLALENPGDIEPSAAIAIRDIIAVAHQPTLFDIFSDAIHGRNRVTRRQRDYLLESARKERT